MNPKKLITIHVTGFGMNISQEDVAEFVTKKAELVSVRLGCCHKTKTRKDFVTIKIKIEPKVLAECMKDCIFRGKELRPTILKIESI